MYFKKSVFGAESRGAENKLPPGAGAGAEIATCGSGFFLFIKDLKKFYIEKIMIPNEVFVNYYNFNPIWVLHASIHVKGKTVPYWYSSQKR